jgi:hypothetical protein
MRIHTDTLLTGDFYDAARLARVTIYSNSLHNSRSRDHAFDFSLRGGSNRYPMGGDDGSGLKAATWDEWGIFLSVLFGKDPEAVVSRIYDGLVQFEQKTFYRFSEGDHPSDMHGDHKWEFFQPYIQKCAKCSAKFATM